MKSKALLFELYLRHTHDSPYGTVWLSTEARLWFERMSSPGLQAQGCRLWRKRTLGALEEDSLWRWERQGVFSSLFSYKYPPCTPYTWASPSQADTFIFKIFIIHLIAALRVSLIFTLPKHTPDSVPNQLYVVLFKPMMYKTRRLPTEHHRPGELYS